MKEADLFWIAGVIDSSHTVIGRTRHQRAEYSIEFTVRDPRLGRELERLIGMSPRTFSNGGTFRRGCKEHCKQPHIHQEYERTTLKLVGITCYIILWNCHRYLRCKGPEARSVMDQYERVFPQGITGPRSLLSFRRMQGLGWSVPEWEYAPHNKRKEPV